VETSRITFLERSEIWRKLWKITSWLMLTALLINLCLNSAVKTISPSINFDDGWIAAINYLPFSKFIAGHDYTYTYGPLAFIFHCVNKQPNKDLANLFFLFEHAVVGWVLWLYRKNFPSFRFSISAIALLVSQFAVHGDMRTPAGDEYIQLIILVMILSVSRIGTDKQVILSSILSSILAAMLIFVKFDLGVEVIITYVVYVLSSLLSKKAYSRKAFLVFCSGFFASCLVFGLSFFKDPSNVIKWILAGINISQAYTDGWSSGSLNTIFPWLTIVAIYLLVTLVALSRKEELGLFGLTLLPSVLLGFVHGFIIEDIWHIQSFFKYMLVVLAFSLLYCKRVAHMCLLIPAFYLLSQLTAYVDDNNEKWWSQANQPSRLESLKLSDDFLSREIGTKQKANYDSVPSNIMWCLANHLEYKPNPCLLLSLACSDKLDKQMASYYASNQAPDFLFCEFSSLVKKHMFFETPETWRTIMGRYRLYNFSSEKQVILLEKKNRSESQSLLVKEKFVCEAQQWYKVRHSQSPLYCSFNFKPNFIGKICKLFYKVPDIYLNVRYAGGQIQTFKLVPGVSKNGLLINYLPEDLEGLRQLFQGWLDNWVTEFELSGPGLKYYENPIDSLWLQENNKTIQTKMLSVVSALPSNFISESNSKNKFMVQLRSAPSETKLINNVPVYENCRNELLGFTFVVNDREKMWPAGEVFFQVDDLPIVKMASRILLLESAGSILTRELLTGGFALSMTTKELHVGLHTIRLIVRPQSDTRFYIVPDVAKFIIE